MTWSLHNEEFHDLYPTLNIIMAMKLRMMKWAEYVARKGENLGILLGKHQQKRSL
jgi:hypothetical protein